MDVDLNAGKLGTRSNRYAMVVDNGEIVQKWVEESPGDLKVSSADAVLKALNSAKKE
jgi:peroxiredoxin